MPGFTRTTRIERPVDAVYGYVVDLERVPEWMPRVRESTVLTEGPLRVGTRFRQRRLAGGKERVADIEVVGCEPGRLHALQLTILGITMRLTFAFTPEGDRATRVDYVARYEGPPWLQPFVAVVARAQEAEDDDILERLARAAGAALDP